jgi:hypothetical protein
MGHTISHASSFKAGEAKGPRLNPDGDRGSAIMLPTIESYPAPGTATSTDIVASTATPAAGDLVLSGVTAVTGSVVGGVFTATVCRNVTVTSSNAADNTQTVNVYGTDANGNLQGETLALNGAATVTGFKAFKTVTRMAIVGATLAGNFTAGTGLIIGLKHTCLSVGGNLVAHRFTFENGVSAAGTFSPGTTVTPQTASIADNRAKYTPASYAATLTIMYFPDLTKEGIGLGMVTRPGPNFVHSDQGNSNGAP